MIYYYIIIQNKEKCHTLNDITYMFYIETYMYKHIVLK